MNRWLPRAVVGFGTAAVALAAGEVAAAFVRPEAAPVIAIGNRFVTLTPEWLKAFATRDLGTSDKTVLIVGIYVVIALLAVPIGWLAERNLPLAVATMVAFDGSTVFQSCCTAPWPCTARSPAPRRRTETSSHQPWPRSRASWR